MFTHEISIDLLTLKPAKTQEIITSDSEGWGNYTVNNKGSPQGFIGISCVQRVYCHCWKPFSDIQGFLVGFLQKGLMRNPCSHMEPQVS